MAGKRRSDLPTIASSSEALTFVRELQAKFLRPEGRPFDDLEVQAYLKEKGDPEKLRSIARRVAIDVLKRTPPASEQVDGSPAVPGPVSPPRGGKDPGKRTAGPSPRKPRRSAGSD
jgi:hypothetical protein